MKFPELYKCIYCNWEGWLTIENSKNILCPKCKRIVFLKKDYKRRKMEKEIFDKLKEVFG
ncbi:MAG: hypothetical protein EWM50_05985 [Gottschalkiaceae bacterium]|nr:MAG: hypothetical protein EWM50_05985 [Gottschalkiaceae bacterium]